ncbi:tyrosine-type recombinase/integrase [Vampirovibrio chlorellavorus]|uniref:tyrosine-type recombinase/integrase n=1 Tax=Vampirovibrio chlorellavorus TaxID=758823 RepID=UPI0026EECFEB|nr:tyrosine-type recombinase/integrase [Vampirovibrio chlorellavorus]
MEGVAGSNPVGPTIYKPSKPQQSPAIPAFSANPGTVLVSENSQPKSGQKRPKKGQTDKQLTSSSGHFLSVGDVAKILGVSRQTVKTWCETGKLSAIPKPYGGSITYQISPLAVELLLAQQDQLTSFKSASKTNRKPQVLKSHPEFVPVWIKAMQTGVFNGKVFSSRTVEIYQLYVEKFFESYSALSADSLKEKLASIPAEHFAKREKIFKALVCLGKYLIQEKALSESFLEEVKPLTPRRHLPPKKATVDTDSLTSLLKACESPLDTLLVTLLAHTGLRASEACQLRFSDIDLKKAILTVQRGKGGKTRKVGLPVGVIEAIQSYRETRIDCGPSAYLFLNRVGKPMDRHGIHQRIQRIARDAGVTAYPHALRRAFVTLNANKGRSLVMLQIACGHSDIATTRSYCMTTEQEVVEAMRTWDEK